MRAKTTGKLRVGLAASSGGHLNQLSRLEAAWTGQEVFWVATQGLPGMKTAGVGVRTYAVGECNRRTPLRTLGVAFRCLRVALRERPDVVISTGAAAGCLFCVFAKILGAKVIWVDSITNVGRLSLGGRVVRPLADLFLVQWPELAEGPRRVEYAGAVI